MGNKSDMSNSNRADMLAVSDIMSSNKILGTGIVSPWECGWFIMVNGYSIVQARILALNASYFLKNGGHFVISIKVLRGLRIWNSFSSWAVMLEQLAASITSGLRWSDMESFVQANCIDSTMPAEAVFAAEVEKLKLEQFKPSEQVTLEPFERDHACVVGGYRMPKKQKATS